MEAGQNVRVAEVSAVLGDKHLQTFAMRREHLKVQKQELKEARTAFASYTRLLTVADMKAARNESINNARISRGLSPNPNIDTEAEGYYEHALERLDEILSSDASLERFLDREWNYHEPPERCSISPFKFGVPRLIIHKKHVYEKAEDNVFLDSLYSVKMKTLQEAIADPCTSSESHTEGVAEDTAANKDRLRDLLNTLNDLDEL